MISFFHKNIPNFKGIKGSKPAKIIYTGDQAFSLLEQGSDAKYIEIVTTDKNFLDELLASGKIDTIEEINEE
jgi:hypothetical protein